MTDAVAPGKHAASGAVNIHYQDSGSGPPLLVLNGWTASGLIWPDEWLKALEPQYRLLRVCNRGTGWSDHVTDPFTVADMVADAVAVLDAEGIDRAHVFGLSMGGMITQQLALTHPARVDHVVLCATAPPPPDFVTADPAVFSKLFTPPADATNLDEIVGNVWSSIVGPGFQERTSSTETTRSKNLPRPVRSMSPVVESAPPLVRAMMRMPASSRASRAGTTSGWGSRAAKPAITRSTPSGDGAIPRWAMITSMAVAATWEKEA